LGQAIEENIACAKYFEELVKASDDFEMLAPVELSIFCFRYVPKGFTGDLDVFNERLLVRCSARAVLTCRTLAWAESSRFAGAC
jgi:glutamate/tyrosine decarboxylase-like PLP-dependent enzyme